MRTHHLLVDAWVRKSARCLLLGVAGLLALAPTGCSMGYSQVFHPSEWALFKSTPPPPGPADSLVLHGDQLEQDKAPADAKAAADLAGAHELYRRQDYPGAQKLFRRLADNTKNSEQVAEEARFYQGECLYRQKIYPDASDVYNRLLNDFPSGAHREQALKRKFDIANFWLDPTRDEMRREREKQEGKGAFQWPSSPLHFDKTRPLLDQEGRAVEGLEQVVYNDPVGPLADEALFLCGSVNFYRQNYREADRFFSQLAEMHPNSKYAPQAYELGIIAKHMSTGGSDYDGRKVAEARLMVYQAQEKYPELSAKKSDFFERQMRGINQQQAEKDFKVAEFYRRTGHPGSAFFCYEIVIRRYPGSAFAKEAQARKQELEGTQDRSRTRETESHDPKAPPVWPDDKTLPLPPPAKVGGQPEVGPVPRPMTGSPSAVSPPPPEVMPAPRMLPGNSSGGQ